MSNLQDTLVRTKLRIFANKNSSAFLASIMSHLEIGFKEDLEVPARCNLKRIEFNPEIWSQIDKEDREMLLLHELWHVARLHSLRRVNRDPETWNIACDIVINNALYHEGYNVDKLHGCRSNKFLGKSEEEVYKLIYEKKDNQEKVYSGQPSSDIEESNSQEDQDEEKIQAINNLIQAQQASQQAGESNSLMGGAFGAEDPLIVYLNDFLKPKINWKILLRDYLNSLSDKNKSTWKKRNRRFQSIYLPGKNKIKNKLDHLVYFLDVSGSISDEEVKVFNSEVRAIKKQFNPRLLTVIQFDTKIQRIEEFTDDQEYKNIQVVKGGGTSYRDVHDYIIQHKPTCSIIFTDLYCDPMDSVADNPVIWVVIDNSRQNPPFGKVIHIKTEK